jgi:hypothetical protein
MSAPPPDEFPLRIGAPAEFACIRGFLRDIAFNDRAVCAALKVRDIAGSRDLRPGQVDWGSASLALRTAIALFVLGAPASRDDFREICGEEIFATFNALGLIRDARRRDGTVVCPVWLYPVDGFIVASDRRDDPDGEAHRPPTDVVFPGLDAGTLKLLRLLPATHGGDGLDVCGGCGIGALHLSRSMQRAVSTDITPRSAFFAAFNAQLNGVSVESLEGDLYAPVTGRHFDVIAAHPPWVPSTGDAMVFRDGGDAGEAIIRRIIEGIPEHLRRNGTAVIVSLGRDTVEIPYERRVRGWLGTSGRDCDVILGVEKMLSIEEVVGSVRKLHLKDDRRQADRLADHLRALGTDKFIYGALFVRRTDQSVGEPPVRLRMSSSAAAADFDRVFTWRRQRRNPDFYDWMKSARPRLAPHLEVIDRRVVTNGALVAGDTTLKAQYAFSTMLRLDAWVIPVIASFRGDHSVEQVFAKARGSRLPGDFTLPAFIDLAAMMIEYGFLDIDIPSETR